MPTELATKLIKRTLQIKKETEWIYITKIKGSGYKDKKALELEKKWGKENDK